MKKNKNEKTTFYSCYFYHVEGESKDIQNIYTLPENFSKFFVY